MPQKRSAEADSCLQSVKRQAYNSSATGTKGLGAHGDVSQEWTAKARDNEIEIPEAHEITDAACRRGDGGLAGNRLDEIEIQRTMQPSQEKREVLKRDRYCEDLSSLDEELVQLVSESSAREGAACFEAAARSLLEKGASINRSHAMHHAASQGKVVALVELRCLGGDVNHRDKDQCTPLHACAGMPTLPYEAMLTLVNLGADRFARDAEGRRPAEVLLGTVLGLAGWREAMQLPLECGTSRRERDKARALWLLISPAEQRALLGKGVGAGSAAESLVQELRAMLLASCAPVGPA